MALALIGESLLTAVIEVLVNRLTSPEVLSFFKSHKLDDDLLEKLKETLNTVTGLLDDAEEKQITKASVKNWLNDLKHAVYEAEDLQEEIDYEILQSKDQNVTSRVRNCVPFLNPANKRMKVMEAKLQKIYEKLKRLVKHNGDLRHIEGTSGGRPLYLSEKTSPLVDESHVYGRDADKEAIMQYLLSSNEAYDRNVVVIPIVGMAGIGKTTLAQLIYNDRRVEEWFELKAWVWASQQFDVFRVMDDILKKINARTCGTKEPDESIKEALQGKRFLLVLDDVWNIQYTEWEKLLLPLQYAKQGSKVVVTTRDEGVAKVLQTFIPSYSLKGLCDDDCWQLFARHAFSGVNSGALSHLEAFGREIVRKCRGLPLAAKTLGGVLHSEGDVKEWEKISKSNMWGLSNENIPPALTLSYYYLPSNLKQCFAFCAIFPKGFEFHKEELVSLWMAEGFLVQSRSKGEFEEIGDKLFNELVSRSFFQQSRNSDPSYFIMHDLICDLAEYVSGEFCFKFVGEEGEENSSMLHGRTRHFAFSPRDGHVAKIFECIRDVQHLRTFLPLPCQRNGHSLDKVLDLHDVLIILKCLRLRVLSLPMETMDQLPNSIGNLKHLRYLDLSYTSIERLPTNVSTLYSLQTLVLNNCRHLIKLPTNMSKLLNLQHLYIEGTQLRKMPSEMGKLRKLRSLTDFFLGKQSGSSIKELGKLLHLRGNLHIWKLQNVLDVRDVLDANLKGKKQLEKLRLTWDDHDTDGIQHERDILENLEPSTNVKELGITGYGGTTFPGWVGNSSFSNMVTLTVAGCKNCTSLPPLGQLPSLENLDIKGFDEVVAVGPEFYGHDTLMEKPFKSLKYLNFEQMPQWQEWNTDVAGAFPLLNSLYIEGCPQLVVSLSQALKLTQIYLHDSGRYIHTQISSYFDGYRWLHLHIKEDCLLKGMEQMSGLSSSFSEVSIDGCSSLKCCQLDFLPRLSKFLIEDCSNLESLCIRNGPLGALHSLTIKKCPNLVAFPEGGLPAPNLKRIELNSCKNLKSLPENMHSLLPSLKDMKLISLPQVDSFPRGGLPSKLTTLHIEACNKLIGNGLPSLPSLTSFNFGDDDDVKSFPEEILLLPSTLTSLKIWDLRNLKSLHYNGLQQLTSLRELKIQSCPKLESLPEEGLPSTLEHLEIVNCPLLEKRCESETGEDWHKISSIRRVYINDQFASLMHHYRYQLDNDWIRLS